MQEPDARHGEQRCTNDESGGRTTSWSTRELADLAGTTVNTVRHYHRTGLLALPDRRSNGYKQYGAKHLVRLLQIRRLRDIGMPISQIQRLDSGVETSPEVLATIDAQLAETIDRYQRARAEIAAMLLQRTGTEVACPLTADRSNPG